MKVKKKFNFIIFCSLNVIVLGSVILMFFFIMNDKSDDQPKVNVIAQEKSPRLSQLKLPITAPKVTQIKTPTFEISRKQNIEERIELSGTQSTSFRIKLDEQDTMLQHSITTSISDVSSNSFYTLIITFNGTEIYNSQHKGTVTLETTNCMIDQDIKVYIINSTTKPFNCDVLITSYGQ